VPVSTLEKFRGGMLGGALGDAVGALAASHGDYESLIDWIGEGDILRYTDDTAMLIGIAEALTKSGGGINEEEIGKIFQRNYVREPWRNYSQSLTAIFATVKRHEVPFSEAAGRLHEGKGSPGNGAAMRNTPVGLLFRNSARLREFAEKTARITHTHEVGVDGAAIMAWATAQLANIDPKAKFPFASFCTGIVSFAQTKVMRLRLVQMIELIASNAPAEKAAAELDLSQTVKLELSESVAESLPYAIYSFLANRKSFKECVYCAVLQGVGDRNTMGAMAGALSGAYLGGKAIPKDWISRVENREMLEGFAKQLNNIDV
jgi:poly(ADP-ribose) glycohydrolase ARH3